MLKLTPSASSIISRPTVASVVHLQFAIALAAHRLCTLHLHTSHDRPCDVTANENLIFFFEFYCFDSILKVK